MTLHHFFTILRAPGLGLAVVLTFVTVTSVTSLRLPKPYTATASVHVDLKSTDTIAGPELNGMMMPTDIAAPIDSIQSERMARRAIAMLGLQDSAELRTEWQDGLEMPLKGAKAIELPMRPRSAAAS
jgi:uncharacterized protein involved in exopolysaccharide biosynthesis